MAGSVLRLFRFRPVGPGFDVPLRDRVVPELLRAPGVRGVFAGRIGPDEIGERALVSLWSARTAMSDALGEDAEVPMLAPDVHQQTAERSLEVAEVAVEIGGDTPEAIGIIRIVHGRTRAGELESYVAEAREGTVRDRAAGVGPRALYLAVLPPDRFITVSLWDAWEHVAAATGADAAHVERTRHTERLVEWAADHYEVVPGIAVILPPVTAPGATAGPSQAEPAELHAATSG